MSNTPLRDAIANAKLEDLPTGEAEIGVVVKNRDVGVAGQVSTPIGKGWSVAAAGQWMKDAGWSLAAMLGWKKKESK